MTISLTAARPGGVFWRLVLRSRAVAKLHEREKSSRLIRLAIAGAVALSIAWPLIDLARIAFEWAPVGGKGMQALVATACYLPLHIRHVLYGVRGSRPGGTGWTLPAMAAVIIGAVPVIGVGWLPTLSTLAVSVLILVRVPWSLAICAGLVAAPIPLAIVFGAPQYGPSWALGVAWRTAAVFVVIWLIRAIRELEAARLALAEEAVTRERLRIDDELRRTLGVELEAIAGQAERASDMAGRPPAVIAGELRALAEGSRRTLAEARRMARGYQQVSLRAELDTAATLLTAAGIQTRVVLAGGDLPDTVEETLRSALRSAIAGLLGDDATRSCVITVVRRDGRVGLALRAQRAGSAVTEVTAP
jgi:two-component system sensor histidine kinase DesK